MNKILYNLVTAAFREIFNYNNRIKHSIRKLNKLIDTKIIMEIRRHTVNENEQHLKIFNKIFDLTKPLIKGS